jgi:carbonic anhydrase
MKLKNLLKLVSLIKILLIVSLFTPVLLTGCSSSSAATEKKKSKKSAEAEEEESEEKSEEKGEEPEKKEESAENSDDKKKEEKGEHSEEHSDDDKKGAKKAEHKKADEKSPSGEEIWADLMKGNKRFVAGKHTAGNLASMRKGLVSGQKPKVIILGCADSRVPPELLFDKNLGELFVVRDAGNIADKFALGSIEYAIEHLHTKVLVILGHESCGAVNAALSGEKMPTKNLQAIVDKISPAFENSKECPMGSKLSMACVKENVHQSAKDVLLGSAVIKKAAKDEITIIKAVYSLETGEVTRLD